ncbi:MAG: hypothetical protein ALMCE001_13320 [Methanocorpusculum sp. MCE]|nr:MAG: hypothetical protein ALMCE001_13320 [Methanocorpusculum sp. MCE]
MAEFYVYTTGTPASQVIVSADGYYTASAPVTVPASGETTQVTVTLEAKPVGGDRGFLQVNTNIIGAKVDVMSISGSVAETGYTDINVKIEFAIFKTGTPISSVVVSAPGWVTQTVSVTVPAKGQTETVNIEMVSTDPIIGGDRGVISVTSNVEGAKVELISISGDVGYTGTISNGKADIAVYTTGTPVNQARVSATGYQTATVGVTMPAKGETVTVNVPLTVTSYPMGFALIGLLGVIGVIALVRRDYHHFFYFIINLTLHIVKLVQCNYYM